MRVLIAAGGTGGHLFPALAVSEAIAREPGNHEVCFLGVGTELEQKLLSGKHYEVVPFHGVLGKGWRGALKSLLLFPTAFLRVARIFRREKPAVVIGFGGYPSVVPIIVAKCFCVPVILHEQNVKVGLANRWLSLLANKIFAVHGAQGFCGKPVQYLDNPVRPALSAVSVWRRPVAGERFVILVFGGSQGAKSLNDAVLGLNAVFQRLQIAVIHQVGRADYERVSRAYQALPHPPLELCEFIEDMKSAYEKSHLVICRAGAMSAAEVTAVRRPAIFVPLAIAAGHQELNVRHLVETKRAMVVKDGPGLAAGLATLIEHLVTDASVLEKMVLRLNERPASTASATAIAQAVLNKGGQAMAEK